jgi:hypothetical protein
MGLITSIILGSLVYIWENYKELFLFLQIIILPGVYSIGYEILIEKQRKNFEYKYNHLQEKVSKIKEERDYLRKIIQKD